MFSLATLRYRRKEKPSNTQASPANSLDGGSFVTLTKSLITMRWVFDIWAISFHAYSLPCIHLTCFPPRFPQFFRREGAALHRMVQNRGNKPDSEVLKRPRRDSHKSLPLKKRPVDRGALETNLTDPVSTSPVPQANNDLRSSSVIGSLLSASRHRKDVSLEQVMNEAVLTLLRGSNLRGYSTSVDPSAFSTGVHVLQQPRSSLSMASLLASQQQDLYFHAYNANSA
jgi:hypothetical protein